MYGPHSACKTQLKFCCFYAFHGLGFRSVFIFLHLWGTTQCYLSLFLSVTVIQETWTKMSTTDLDFTDGTNASERSRNRVCAAMRLMMRWEKKDKRKAKLRSS